jgi:glycerol transport system ATP-binding protein
MARIALVNVAHSYEVAARPSSGAANSRVAWALQPMTMTWEDGGAFALLGPSGCGKTTLLNIISGLVRPSRGQVLFDQRDVTQLAPEARSIAQVFQFPVVYESMTVFDNLAFPLRNRQWGRAQIRKRVQEIAEMLELSADLPRRAHGLSAEIKQKISLGRGLVRPDVAAILFDEPLTVIDPHVKWLLRRKLKEIHQQLALSMIYVTHDQTEALTFADHVIVMTHGEVVQMGTAEELFETPAHRFVGHFIGSPGMNFVPCEWRDDAAHIQNFILETASTSVPPSHETLCVGIRPEYVELKRTQERNCLPARVLSVHEQGIRTLAELEIAGSPIWVRLREPPQLQSGPVFARFPAERCALYADERRVA